MPPTPWIDIPPGATVRGRDGYEWRVIEVARPDPGMPPGTIKVVMERDGRPAVTGHPPAGTLMDVLSMPPEPDARAAVALLRRELGAELVSCAWCSGDPGAECACDVHCGKPGCVNFR